MIPWAMIIDPRLSHNARQVFSYLQGNAYRIKGTGAWQPVRAYASVIAEELGWRIGDERERNASRRRVQRAVRQLEQLGYLRVMRWPGRSRSNGYDVNPAWEVEAQRATQRPLFPARRRMQAEAEHSKERQPVTDAGVLTSGERGDARAALSAQKGDTQAAPSRRKSDTRATPFSRQRHSDKRQDRQGERPGLASVHSARSGNGRPAEKETGALAEDHAAAWRAVEGLVPWSAFARALGESRHLTPAQFLRSVNVCVAHTREFRGCRNPGGVLVAWIRVEDPAKWGDAVRPAPVAVAEPAERSRLGSITFERDGAHRTYDLDAMDSPAAVKRRWRDEGWRVVAEVHGSAAVAAGGDVGEECA